MLFCSQMTQKTFASTIAVSGATVGDQFRFWFITARGNQFTPLIRVNWLPGSLGNTPQIGALLLDWAYVVAYNLGISEKAIAHQQMALHFPKLSNW